MIVFAWIGIALASVLALLLLIVVGALASRLDVEGRIRPEGFSGRGRLGIVAVEADATTDLLVVRLFGLRVYRGTMSDSDASGKDATQHDDDEVPTADAKRSRDRRARPRLPVGSYRRLARTGLRELRTMARHLHVRHLRVDAVVATDDPALTGELYGVGCAIVAWIHGVWPRAELSLDVDFTRTRPSGAAELAASVRPIRLIPGGIRLAWSYWSERRWSRRRASGAPRAASTG